MAFLAKEQKVDLSRLATDVGVDHRYKRRKKKEDLWPEREKGREENEFLLKKMELEIEAKKIESTTGEESKDTEELWVSHLIGLLPNDMAQLIARKPEEVTGDYEQLKQILHKLSAEMFRQMFTKHLKNADETWKDFMYELRTYFQE
ncbi:hypothetical protein AVEN_177644-1 [Araneus ventricosus]|uniref:Uncharacterized protein n=1 Tax=Araneus ventricosus TaxID=182803 RepID=A0A4Y2NYE3_ARAVE|nr:hypothetical protein AVEN_177644-1 [Araneus ventricosus]